MIYIVRISAEDLEVLGQGLDELKFKVSKPVILRIQAQIDEQNKAAAEARAAAEAQPKMDLEAA